MRERFADTLAMRNAFAFVSALIAFLLLINTARAQSTIGIGETAVLSTPDCCNANLLLAQQATLSQTATIDSLSFYVTTAAGNLMLGIYDATGPSGGPGKLRAYTNSFATVEGWNTATVVKQISLPAGSYWLAYLPSSNSLSFVKQNNLGNCFYYGHAFSGGFPTTFAAEAANCTPTAWSFYATLTTTAAQAVNGSCGSSNGADLTSAPTANLCTAGTASAVSGSGPWTWSCAGLDGGTTASCSAKLLTDGACGSANGVAVSSAPTANLCLAGTASTVTGSGPWNWTCSGSNGGTTASCSAPLSSSSGSSGSGASASNLLPSASNAIANWQKAGMLSVGGIPNRTTTCATLSPLGGGQDDSTAINNAIASCPAGEVVSLAAGTFTIAEGNVIWINKGVTVRGAGAGSTILTRTNGATMGSSNPGSNPSPMVVLSPICWNNCNDSYSETTALTEDGTQGSYSVTVASAAGFAAGQFVLIDEEMGGSWQQDPQGFTNEVWAAGTYPDYELVWPDHNPQMGCDNSSGELPTQSGGDGNWFSNLDRFTNEVKKVASVSGNTITFDSPLTSNYRVSHTARLYAYTTPFLQEAGVEDLTAEYSDYGAIDFQNCAYCWANKVEATLFLGQGGYGGFNVSASFRVQLEEVYSHKPVWPVPGGDGYDLSINWGSSEILVENSIFTLANKVDVVQSAGAGSVFGYNYFDDGFIGGDDTWIETGMNGSHFIGSHHLLFEGNQAFDADDDGTWGSVHYQTFYRNWLTGFRAPFSDYINGNAPINDYTDTPAGINPYRALSTMQWAYNNTYIGNVLGTSGDMAEPTTWIYGNGNINSSTPSELLLGYDSCNGVMDPEVIATATVAGNYDYVQNQVTWTTLIPQQSLPNSMYLTSEPAFFTAGKTCTYTWPWVNPTGATVVYQNSCGGPGLPARARFNAGTPFTQP
jgi:hypothetical protein